MTHGKGKAIHHRVSGRTSLSLSFIDEVDGATITINDLVCMMLQIGASDSALQKELGAIQNPTLPAFNRVIEGYEQARKTTASSAHGNIASKAPPRRISGQNQQKNNRSSNPRGRGEKLSLIHI